ncbi:hypothetical protein BEP19_14810 [Ammoniphilus oxalaticus]|uniref:DUF5048 domain-containing protein n=1 Tax=Ammoniphilus oxalaticus TaxID=66863 RepID=A0A419SEI0_9BACL|nr:hypothetical protein [Ammoniphilus oxalaticus]RKD21489.1 hypothetical protein BEP19_14810 [Ammoniphilus oxalaticus]
MINSDETIRQALVDPIKEITVKIELLDSDENVIDEITSAVMDGNISVDKDRDTRRTFSLILLNDENEFTWSIGGRIWLDKRVKLWIGIKSSVFEQVESESGVFLSPTFFTTLGMTYERRDSTVYIPQGVFVLSEMSATSSYTGERTAILSGSDKWQLLSGDPVGKFTNVTSLAAGVKISDAIRLIASDAGITKFLFDDCDVTLPYSLTYQPGEARGKAIKELAELAVYSIFFDVNGYLRFRPQIDVEKTASVWTYDKSDYTLYAKSEKRLEHSELYNKILVIGGSSQTATVSATAEDNRLDSPTGIPTIGERLFLYNNGSPDPLITTIALAQSRANYELRNRLRVAEKQPIDLLPNYLHDAEDVITIIDDWTNTDDKYELISFNIPLSAGGMMSAEAWRVRNIGGAP